MVEKPLRGLESRRADALEIAPVVWTGDMQVQEIGEHVRLIAGEERVQGEQRVEPFQVERRLCVELGVVEVRAGLQANRPVREGWVRVEQVALVLANLFRRVENVLLAAA